MKDYECMIMCPKCGTLLFKSKCVGMVEARCPKCNKVYKIEQSGESIKVTEPAYSYKAGKK